MQCSHQTRIYILILGIVKPILYQYIVKRKRYLKLYANWQRSNKIRESGIEKYIF